MPPERNPQAFLVLFSPLSLSCRCASVIAGTAMFLIIKKKIATLNRDYQSYQFNY